MNEKNNETQSIAAQAPVVREVPDAWRDALEAIANTGMDARQCMETAERALAASTATMTAPAQPAELSKAFMTLESSGGEGRTIVLKFNQREDAYTVHDFLLKAGGQDYRAAAPAAQQAAPILPIYQASMRGGWEDVQKWQYDLYKDKGDGSIQTRIVYAAPATTGMAQALQMCVKALEHAGIGKSTREAALAAAKEALEGAGMVGQDAKDAALWRAFLSSARIRIIGSAGINQDAMPDGEPYNNYAHFGMEIRTKYDTSLSPEQKEQMEANNTKARALLTRYAEIAMAAQQAQASAKGEQE